MPFFHKKISYFFVAFISILIVSGCGSTPSNNTTITKNPTTSSQNKENLPTINFDKLNELTKNNFTNSKTYPLIQDTDFSLLDNKGSLNGKIIVLTAIVGDSINKNNLLSLADSMLRSYGSNASFMYSNLSAPSQESYGGIFDLYDARLIIVPASSPKSKSFIDVYIPAGMQTKKAITLGKDFKN